MSLLVLALVSLVHFGAAETPKGVVPLDSITFNQIVDGSRTVLVKFDKKYAYGDNENAWKDFATNYGGSAELLLTEVGISEHGDNKNEELGERYSIDKDSYPQYRLFLRSADTSSPIKYEYQEKVRSDELAQFVRKNGVYLALNGCLKDFDELVGKFMVAKDKAERDQIGAEGKGLLDGYKGKEEDEKSGKYYMKVMAKVTKEGNEYIGKEIKRLDSLLNGETYIAEDKKPWFRKRLNILSIFREKLPEDDKKEL
mmetsp:Transcript_55220/g.88079  ORF Transcript_55220/g.88079 Transcript_55220/m.88079 type:complete len:255 (+) Transcript_55220:23-787(+)